MGAARIVSQLAQLAIFVVAAHVLGPAEFGVFALVSAVATMARRVSEAGWSEFIINSRAGDDVIRHILFIAIASGLLACLLGIGASLIVPFWRTADGIATLGLLFSIWVLLATYTTAQGGVLIRRERHRPFALAQITGELVGLGVAVGALNAGYGLFSLIFGRLAMEIVGAMVMVWTVPLLPKAAVPLDLVREVLRFSGHIVTIRFIGNLRLNAATFFIGFFAGPAAVGYYRAADRLISAFAEVVAEPTRWLGWSLFRRARADAEAGTGGLAEQANTFFPVVTVVAVPVFVGLAILGGDVIAVLLGETWRPAAQVVPMLALARLLQMPEIVSVALFSLTGNERKLPRLVIAYSVAGIAVTILVAPYGIVAVAWAELFMGAMICLAFGFAYRRVAGIRWIAVTWRLLPSVPALIVGAALLWFLAGMDALASHGPVARIAIIVPPVLAVYVMLLAAFNWRYAKSVLFRRDRPGG